MTNLLVIAINKYAIFFRTVSREENIIYKLVRISLKSNSEFRGLTNSCVMLIAIGCQEVLSMKG